MHFALSFHYSSFFIIAIIRGVSNPKRLKCVLEGRLSPSGTFRWKRNDSKNAALPSPPQNLCAAAAPSRERYYNHLTSVVLVLVSFLSVDFLPLPPVIFLLYAFNDTHCQDSDAFYPCDIIMSQHVAFRIVLYVVRMKHRQIH